MTRPNHETDPEADRSTAARLDARHYGDELQEGERPVPDDVPPVDERPVTDTERERRARQRDLVDDDLRADGGVQSSSETERKCDVEGCRSRAVVEVLTPVSALRCADCLDHDRDSGRWWR